MQPKGRARTACSDQDLGFVRLYDPAQQYGVMPRSVEGLVLPSEGSCELAFKMPVGGNRQCAASIRPDTRKRMTRLLELDKENPCRRRRPNAIAEVRAKVVEFIDAETL